MKKLKENWLFLISIAFCVLFITGCSAKDFSIEGKIAPPKNEAITVKGTWGIEKFITIKEDPTKNYEDIRHYIGKTAMFDQTVCEIGRDECAKPVYKIINVSALDYMQNKYKVNPAKLGIDNQRIDVITVTSNNQTFYELIKKDDQTMFAYVDGGFLSMHKQSDKVSAKPRNNHEKNQDVKVHPNGKDNDSLKSGVLLGIRSKENTYRTLWISVKNKKLKSVMEKKQLFVPRMKGFWEVGYFKADKGTEGSLYVKPIQDKKVKKHNILTESNVRKILFVGNDYVGTENLQRYQVLPIDHISVGKGITPSDITDENVDKAILRSSEAFLSSLDREQAQMLDKKPKEDNFTLERRNGHWIMRGRLNYNQPIGLKKYEDYDINVMVPKKLINYDEMTIPWGEIKSKMPWIMDAYVSPNKNIAILVSKEKLYVYSIDKGNISKHSLKEIPWKTGDSIVMAEWAIGDYVNIWEKSVKKNFNPLNEK
ncbi:lipoprotein [Heyndrickxia sporothermodurans]|nr:lipoprotein [Heyndrickxia sporothermodurans]